MPRCIKKILYVIGVYVFVLVLLALITSNSKCNILSSGSHCSVVDAIYMIMLIPVAIPMAIYEASR